jgi:hypothetical protein
MKRAKTGTMSVRVAHISDGALMNAQWRAGLEYTGGMEAVSAKEMPLGTDVWGALHEAHAFADDLREDEACKEIVYITPDNRTNLLWREPLDHTWLTASLNDLQPEHGAVFEIRKVHKRKSDKIIEGMESLPVERQESDDDVPRGLSLSLLISMSLL